MRTPQTSQKKKYKGFLKEISEMISSNKSIERHIIAKHPKNKDHKRLWSIYRTMIKFQLQCISHQNYGEQQCMINCDVGYKGKEIIKSPPSCHTYEPQQ